MLDLLPYPYPTYVPNKVVAGCIAAVCSISLIAWFIQSWQVRFRPPRLCFLLLISHMAIFIDLIVRAAVPADQQHSKNIFIIVNSLFATGQRMIIVSNYIFVMQMHCEKSPLSRGILVGVVLCVITSGLLLAPANMLSFNPDHINSSFLFRKLSALILLAVTLFFYAIWYWSKTVKDMTKRAFILIIVSSVLCVVVAIFNLIQSISAYYDKINSHEVWFYVFQITPLILAHFTWSILHPKRSLKSSTPLISATNDEISIQE
ncbi:unnamed protein product [Rotaria sp. Silwood2]|nr:unnamed protein product [Rotaria sp. Silwood2]CAF2953131.1 unnamed protein product [Rotaria sp. Silwood2]CAF3096729.1 unnamed protein product [Rotaria sp. Silwood2]CAF3984249.1 unnamed protein product [Rotaria sp. Silwood2]CAF4095466.1 unnamed protein product [Rotaria sp. Silwood2]